MKYADIVEIGEVATVKGGKRLPKGVNLIRTPNKHPYIRVRDITRAKTIQINSGFEYVDDDTQKKIGRYIVSAGDIILSIVGSVGLVAVVGESLDNANLTENCVKITDFNGVDRDFLYYYLICSDGQAEMTKGTVGAVQAKLPIKNIQQIKIPLPSMEIQQKIVSILSALDDKIELNQRINDNLQEQAQAIYSNMFIQNTSEQWTEGILSDVASITMGQSPKGDTYNEEGAGTVFFQGRGEFGFRFPTRRLFTTDPKRMAQSNDVLMSVRAPVGDFNVAYEPCCIGRGLGAIRSKDNHQSFVLYTVFSLREKLDMFNSEGTVFGSINRDALNSMPIIIPSKEEIDRFEEIAAPMDAAIRNNYEEICRLEAIRDSLLPRLMSGELDVSDLGL